MKRIAFLLALAACASLAQAQLYKYVDKDGKTVYSDQPPPNLDSKQLNIGTGRTAPSPAPGATASGPKTAVERDKELEKGRQEAREKAAKDGKKAEEAEKNCAAARAAYQNYAQGGRMHKFDEKGEKVILGDEEIEAEKNRTRREMEEACKKS